MPKRKRISEEEAWLECAEWVTEPDPLGRTREHLCNILLLSKTREHLCNHCHRPWLVEESSPEHWPRTEMLERCNQHSDTGRLDGYAHSWSVCARSLSIYKSKSDKRDWRADSENTARVIFCLLMAEECRAEKRRAKRRKR